MSTRKASEGEEPPIERREQLVAPMQAGEKPPERWRIGTEHEKLVYRTADHAAPPYEGQGGIRDILLQLRQFGWEPVEEGGHVIALSGSDGAVSLEPAGQLELSGAPLDNLHQTCAETGRHLDQVKAIGEKCGVGFLGLGMWPDKRRDELPIMPKGRYAIMLRHMPRVGNLGLDIEVDPVDPVEEPVVLRHANHPEHAVRRYVECSNDGNATSRRECQDNDERDGKPPAARQCRGNGQRQRCRCMTPA